MYSRYIPPSKGPKAASISKPLAQPSPAPTRTLDVPPPAPAVAAAPVDGYGYARYVPGAQNVKKPVVQYFDDQPSPPKPKRKRETADESQGVGEQESKKAKTRGGQNGMKPAKNRRKRKQRTRADDDDDDSSDSEDDPPKRAPPETKRDESFGSPTVAEQNDTPSKAKRKEKSKKEKSRTKPAKRAQTSELADSDIEMTDVKEPAHEMETVPAPEPQALAEKKKKKDKEKKKKKSDKIESTIDPPEQEEAPRHKAVLERKAKSLQFARKAAQHVDPKSEEEPAELHGLKPLPQPAVVADDDSKPTYDTLPSWLANPIRVSQDTRQPFTELGILPRSARFLEQKGFAEAFAVQTAAIPLLLPTNTHRPGDVLISAATGSGKTLAYALPIVRDISQGLVTRLRALVVLPTRELVKQAQEVFEICARAYDGEERKKVRIGVAVGHQSIKAEQHSLMMSESRYDPEAYKVLKEQDAQQSGQTSDSANGDDSLDAGADGGERKDARLGACEGEVVDFCSKVDVLICTPGRLVEHVEQTPGFSLDYVRWLVVDEADKLLAQSFQGWLDLVMERFKVKRFGARDFADMEYSGVRKVVLSATLTRDLSLLNQLDLKRPRLVVLENDGTVQIAEHTLPHSLREFAIRVHETNFKPLYLLDLLRSRDMAAVLTGSDPALSKQNEVSDSDSDPDTTSDSGSDTSSDSSDTSSDSSDATSDSDGSSVRDSDPGRTQPPLPQSLIFTKSNEAALRLARLLELLDPSLSTRISTLTSSTPTHIRRKALRAFATASSPVRLIIASDLVARGIDIPKLSNVINYDLPPSVAGYVHRVGRTARAGRSGCAWTLVGDDESGWFWGKIAKGQGVRRAQKVERTRIEEMGEERIKQYEDALADLGKEALEMKRW
ncbi:DEAD/DEAH box helicase domain-containing protein [Hirsutella rhossiliensis]|uniref:ATP-dependent RNA helicase n=1 Tax=Hirsutella rhossiliensis TaxID=111463 RepID=A0A9P8SM14_9HYPO|nr:DEAD/DEAH box helicase domain-containing protein [Hirsutella rhossiliensis]KAH0966859.1 DEAD/DEAH box helicase domain-containing protein [Hirsutella rhossiliensis]